MKEPTHQGRSEDEEADSSFDQLAQSRQAFVRAQKRHFDDNIAEHHPALATALEKERTRFEIVRRDVIEPTMREVAGLATDRGYHVYLASDDAHERMVLLGTPAIRFYCSRRPFPTPVVDLIWTPSFVAFYGCAETGTVQCHVELSEVDTETQQSYDDPPFAYPDVTNEAVGARLMAFVDRLPAAPVP